MRASRSIGSTRPDYWIANVAEGVLEVHRDPVPSENAPYGWVYGRVALLARGDFVAPLAVPEARIAVADLVP